MNAETKEKFGNCPNAVLTARFGRQCERRLVEWVSSNVDNSKPLLEFGSGNGHLLVALAKAGYTRLMGVDYSDSAVTLGAEYAASSGFSHIKFETTDLLNSESINLDPVFLVLDKGTFDAISLGPEPEIGAPKTSFGARISSLASQYKATLHQCLSTDPSSIFMITSCNWTRGELVQLFEPDFTVKDEIMHPTFSFGGHTGQTVTTIIFNRR
jgi:SAM-dependent methyltransferase